MNVEALPWAYAGKTSGPVSKPHVRRQTAIITPITCRVPGKLASTMYSLPLVLQRCGSIPKNV
jgi:hypothetical protein